MIVFVADFSELVLQKHTEVMLDDRPRYIVENQILVFTLNLGKAEANR